MLSKKDIFDHFIEFEADVPHFYLDGEGIISIAIGCQVWDLTYAMTLPLLCKVSGKPATTDQIVTEYKKVAGLEPDRLIQYYTKQTSLYMDSTERLLLFNTRVQAFIKQINGSVTKLSEYPDKAQLVMLDMVFNLGLTKLTTKFPKFLQAFLAKDWLTCAKESQRLKISKSRNDWTEQTLKSLAGV